MAVIGERKELAKYNSKKQTERMNEGWRLVVEEEVLITHRIQRAVNNPSRAT